MNAVTTIEIIAELELALLGPNSSARQKHALNQALLSLVRLAKSECQLQLIEVVESAARRNRSEDFRRQVVSAQNPFRATTLH